MGARGFQAGLAITALGGTFCAGYWIYALQTRGVAFWALPGFVTAGVTLLGLVVILIGLVSRSRSDSTSQQIQRGGPGSTNLQAGRDISWKNSTDNER